VLEAELCCFLVNLGSSSLRL